jgi:hypothetical protein
MENIDTPAGSIRRRNKHKLALCTASNNEYFVSNLLGARKLAVLMTMIDDDDDDYLLECSFLCQNTADSITAAFYASLGSAGEHGAWNEMPRLHVMNCYSLYCVCRG